MQAYVAGLAINAAAASAAALPLGSALQATQQQAHLPSGARAQCTGKAAEALHKRNIINIIMLCLSLRCCQHG
jgi:hypothetical protein